MNRNEERDLLFRAARFLVLERGNLVNSDFFDRFAVQVTGDLGIGMRALDVVGAAGSAAGDLRMPLEAGAQLTDHTTTGAILTAEVLGAEDDMLHVSATLRGTDGRPLSWVGLRADFKPGEQEVVAVTDRLGVVVMQGIGSLAVVTIGNPIV